MNSNKTNINQNIDFETSLGYTSQELMDLYHNFLTARKTYENLWKVLDAYDSGEFWKLVKGMVPAYSIKPDTNWVNYIKTSLVNSLYSGSYRGDVFPRSADYKEQTNSINEFIEYAWNKLNVSYYVLRAGERTALLNFGAIECGWNADIIDRVDKLFPGDAEMRFIENMSLVLDPASKDPYSGRAMFIQEERTIVELRNEKRFRARIDSYLDKDKNPSEMNIQLDDREYGRGYLNQRSRESQDKTVRLLTCYFKYQPADSEGYRIDKIWIIDDGYIIDIQTDIRPKTFPIRILYATPPVKDPYGTPTSKLIMYNAMAINILDSIDATHIYASSKRAKVISRKAGVNETMFAKEGNNPDKLWIVDGDPNMLVRYVDVPDLPADRALLKQKLEYGIMRVSGIDDRYTGRDTGSVQTTGAMDMMNQRISMSDNTRISMLQQFIREITELLLSLYVEHGGKERPFPVYKKDHTLDSIKTLDFEEFKTKDLKFDFVVNVTPDLPNNVMRRGDMATKIMEMQMQYNMQPQLMTNEEWLESQDFPQKYHTLRRLRDERMRNDKEEVMSDLTNYAGMVNQGMRPEAAVDQLAQERQFKRERPGLGNVASGSTQAKQS